MWTFFPDLLRALITTAIAFGPLLAVLVYFSWRALVAGTLVIAAWLVFLVAALAAGGQAWNPGGSGKEIMVVGAAISACLGLAAVWVARRGRRSDADAEAPLSSRLARRGQSLLLGLVAIVWAIGRYDTVPGAWYAVAHPRTRAEQREMDRRYDQARRQADRELRQIAAREAAQADSEAAATAAAEAAQAARAAKPSVIGPLVLYDSAGNAQAILMDERTDVVALDPTHDGKADSIPHTQYLLDLLGDPRMAPRIKGRRVILAVDRRYGTRWFSPRGREVMFRDDSAAIVVRRPQTFYDPRTGAFSLDAYEWMIYVLGMDPLEAWGPYRNNLRRFPPAGSPMPYGDDGVAHRR